MSVLWVALSPWLWQASGLLVLAVVSVLVLRAGLHRSGHAGLTYPAWLMVPLVLGTLVAPSAPVPAVVLALQVKTATVTQTPATLTQSASLWMLLWAAGAAVFIGWAALAQWRFVRSLGPLQPMDERASGRGIYKAGAPMDSGPVLLGLLRPRIVVPPDFEHLFTPSQQALALAHERVHLRRGDLWANALAMLLQTVFWFHPLVHLAARLMRLDQELACDRAVLRGHPGSELDYAQALVRAQGPRELLPLGCHWRPVHPLNQRIKALKHNRIRHISEPLARLLAVAGVGCVAAVAWAAQAPGGATPGAKRFLVDVQVTESFPGTQPGSTSTREIKTQVGLLEGQKATLEFGAPPLPGAPGCDIAFELSERDGGVIDMRVPLRCNALTVQGEPRLYTRIGQPATIEVGEESAPGEGRFVRVVLNVSRWPTDMPWPGSQKLP